MRMFHSVPGVPRVKMERFGGSGSYTAWVTITDIFNQVSVSMTRSFSI
ncbi:hypothetical protein [Mucilaginibacter sp.]|nr:hypothetical protein [Mucilaginibacter sp.]